MKKLYIGKSKISGKGMFTAESIKKGERVGFVLGRLKKHTARNKKESAEIPTWYGVTKTTWIDPGKSVYSCFNHSCDPNTAIIGTKTVIARKNIPADTELTFDYSFTDGDEIWTLDATCNCGARSCRKEIKSIQHLQAKVVKAHFPLIPKYFLNLYKKAHPEVTI